MPFPVIIDMSIHHFDLIRFVTGLEAVKVSGAAWNPPWSNYKGDCSTSVVFLSLRMKSMPSPRG